MNENKDMITMRDQRVMEHELDLAYVKNVLKTELILKEVRDACRCITIGIIVTSGIELIKYLISSKKKKAIKKVVKEILTAKGVIVSDTIIDQLIEENL